MYLVSHDITNLNYCYILINSFRKIEYMIIQVKVLPNSKKCNIEKTEDSSFRVRVDVPAEDGRANRRLIEIFSDYFKVEKSSISILKGFKSRKKIVEIRDL